MGSQWLCDLLSVNATAPVSDPPSDVVGELLPAPGAGGGDTEGWGSWDEGPRVCPLSRTGSRRRWRWPTWSRWWRRSFTPTPTGTVRVAHRWTRWRPAGQRCWKYGWVIDLDIEGFFDNLDHDLILKAVAHHTDDKWILMYVQRWLSAPLRRPDGTLVSRDRGSPQGASISPLLANLFMHYAFDTWMAREFPDVPFERFVDDVIVHCVSQQQAQRLRDAIAARLAECGGLRLHPDQDADRVLQDDRTAWLA